MPAEIALSHVGLLSLARRIADEHRVTLAELLAPRGTPRIVAARDHFLAIVRWSSGLSLPEIGRLLGMDHTSVLYAVRRHERRLNGEPAHSAYENTIKRDAAARRRIARAGVCA